MEHLYERRTALARRAGEIDTRLNELAELEDLADEQSAEFDALREEATTLIDDRAALDADIEQREAIRAAAKVPRNLERPRLAPVPTDRDVYDPDVLFNGPQRAELRSRAISAVEEVPEWELADEGKTRATELIERYDDADSTIAKLVLATGSKVYKTAWTKTVTGRQSMLNGDEQAAMARAMSLTDASGGFAVPFPIDPTLIITGDGSANPFRRMSRVEPITTDSWQGISAGAVSASWDGEGTQVSDDTPTWAQPQVTAEKAQAFVPATIEIAQDYPNLAGDLVRLFTEGKDDLEATAFATGTGTNQPTGIVVALTAGADNVPTSASTDTFAIADVYSTWESLPPKYRGRPGVSWVANLNILNDIRAFGTAVGHAFTVELGADGIPLLFGKPVYESSAMDGTITGSAENYVLVVGDFQNYVIADRVGFSIEYIPHLFATANNRPSGHRGWYAYWRVGADSVNDAAFSMLNVT